MKEVVQKMSGVEASDEITPQQLEALAGGELLRAEVLTFFYHLIRIDNIVLMNKKYNILIIIILFFLNVFLDTL